MRFFQSKSGSFLFEWTLNAIIRRIRITVAEIGSNGFCYLAKPRWNLRDGPRAIESSMPIYIFY